MTKTYTGPIVDVDVHHNPKSDRELTDYLPERWRAYAQGRSGFPLRPPAAGDGISPNGAQRVDAYGADGSRPGSDYATLREQLMDGHNYHAAILTHNTGDFGAHLNPHYAQALCAAANDWNLDTWLPLDDRFHSVVAVSWAQPAEAAREIRRVGGHARMVGVLMVGNVLGRPLGDAIYDPIYEAASELGLAICVHPTRADRPTTVTSVGGMTSSFIENNSENSQQAMHYVSSLVVHGTFERFPSLRVLIAEYGVAWLPPLLWRLDEHHELLKLESPWVRRWPSEYAHDHIKLSTQPIEESPDSRRGLVDLLSTVDGIEDMLCYSSDYPHYSMDDVGYVARRLPAAWHRKVFCDNACATYGWPQPKDDPRGLVHAGER